MAAKRRNGNHSAPWPLLEIAIEPKSKADQDRLGVALARMVTENPSFTVHTDQESGQIILGGASEEHLADQIESLIRVHKLDLNIGAPQVAYRETIRSTAEVESTYKIQTGGGGEFARVKMVFEPGEPGSGYAFTNRASSGEVPKKYVRGVKAGLEQARANGLLAGFPVIDFKATLIGGAYHDLDSSVLAFEIASRAAFRELRKKGAPKLLEPIMKVEVITPDDYVGDAIGDLNSRRAHIQSIEPRGDAQVITTLAPLANMFGYASQLRSFSQGRAQFNMQYSGYAPVPVEPEGDDPRFPPAMAMRA